MGIYAKVLTDSISPAGVRLTTMEVKYWRFIHAEIMTHRVFSRNAASSRAIPVKKMIAAVRQDPAMPIFWGKNQSGMSARTELDETAKELAVREWKALMHDALDTAERLSDSDIDLHKQLVNRILEPYAHITIILTSSQWQNFYLQRAHEDAQPEIQAIARLMQTAHEASTPTPLAMGEWHLPLIQPDERHLDIELLKKISVARCARVSYLTHDNVRSIDKDVELYERLMTGGANGHWSPTEHVATPIADPNEFSGNFRGWHQFRKEFLNEDAELDGATHWLAA
jgi:thymidylate synthase ThyX